MRPEDEDRPEPQDDGAENPPPADDAGEHEAPPPGESIRGDGDSEAGARR